MSVAIVGTAGAASATWTATSTSGSGAAKALNVPQVAGVNAADGVGSSVVTWTAVAAAAYAPGVTGYKVQRYTNATGTVGQTAVCPGALSSTSATCTDSSVAAGTYFYGVSALYKPAGVSWTGPESTRDSAAITAPAATQLVFTSQPSGSTSTATAFPIQPVVAAEDAAGAVVTGASGTVTLTKNGATPPGALAGCISGVALVNGVATFSGCKWDTPTVTGITLKATGTGGSIGGFTRNSNAFNMTGVATKVVFTGQPSSTATAGQAFSAQPVVSVQDSGGRVVTADSTSTVNLALTTAAGATLSCTSTTAVVVSYGVASFSGCAIDKSSATAYTLKATDNFTANSSGITVSPGGATQIALTMSPTGDLGSGASKTLTATIEDAAGNTVTTGADATRTVTFAQSAGTGSMTGLNTSPASAGVATKVVSGSAVGSVTLQASALLTPGSTNSNTVSFTVNAAPTVTSTNPALASKNQNDVVVKILGTNFATGATVSFTGGGITVTATNFISASEIDVTVDLSSSAAKSARDVTVLNTDGGSGTGSGVFTVTQ
jgi:hypothetical protein